ncbi:MAG: nucleoside phosphorylase [Proteobacteria bacterium]|nr:nucleoside phosphorylase [Pseudomonadota bacterium]MBI3495995.1 nucleoside phosphorylase [Pseudomonadota bacterium]
MPVRVSGDRAEPAPRRKRHVGIPASGVPRYLLVPGDPARVPLIGSVWDRYEDVSFEREFRLGRGSIGGVELAACSTGIGGPSTEIAALELFAGGADTFIRVGTCGALQTSIACGDLVIHTGAVRLTGAIDAYAGREYPAIADLAVTQALIEACAELGFKAHVGLTASVDSFYAGQENPVPRGQALAGTEGQVAYLSTRRVLTFEMEAATLFVLGSIYGFRSASICAVGSNRATGERKDPEAAIMAACRAASRAVQRLAAGAAKLSD